MSEVLLVENDIGRQVIQDFFDCIGQVDSVYLYGYSNMSRNAYHLLKSIYGLKIKGIVSDRFPESVDYKANYLFTLENVTLSDSMVLIATNSIFFNEIGKRIKSKSKFLFYYSEGLDEELKKRVNKLSLIETRFLNVCVGQACNYRCKDCANFAPYAKKENMRYPLENIKEDIDKLLPLFSRIDKLHFQGGEPFLYSELQELLDYVSGKYESIIGQIQIATNGGIIPNEKVLRLLQKGEFEVRISDYKGVINSNKLISELEKRKIAYHIYRFAGKKGMWTDSGELNYLDDDKNMENKVKHCRWCTCFTVENHLVGRCARSIPAITLQGIEKKEDYINIDEDLSLEQVRNYFMFIKSMEACKHCKGSGGVEIEAGIQM